MTAVCGRTYYRRKGTRTCLYLSNHVMPASPPPRLRRQLTFLRQLAKEARHLQRQDLLRHANADQINAVSEVILNSL